MSESLRRESAARLFQEADLERSSPGRDASRTIELRPEQPSLTQGMGQDRGRVDPGHRAEPPRRSSPQDEDETEVCWVSRQQQQALPVLPSPLYDPLRPWCHWSRYLRWTEVPYPREPETGGEEEGRTGWVTHGEGALPPLRALPPLSTCYLISVNHLSLPSPSPEALLSYATCPDFSSA